MDIKEFKNIVAQNIYYLRTENHMTQYELGEKLNYSDKAISKWERGDGLPDAYVLNKMSQLFGVTVDYMLTPHSEQNKKVETQPIKKAKRIVSNIVAAGIFTLALLIFVLGLPLQLIVFFGFKIKITITFSKKGKRKVKDTKTESDLSKIE